jgi:hypothetical protein
LKISYFEDQDEENNIILRWTTGKFVARMESELNVQGSAQTRAML